MVCVDSHISVVIPYHNREQYIDEAIQSVLAQTLEPLEIIIVIDCSRESARRNWDRYAETCTIIDLPMTMGIASVQNQGIRLGAHYLALRRARGAGPAPVSPLGLSSQTPARGTSQLSGSHTGRDCSPMLYCGVVGPEPGRALYHGRHS
jgi:Glycosyl transferase family 2